MRQQIKINAVWVDGAPEINARYKQQVGEFYNGTPVWEIRVNTPITPEPLPAIRIISLRAFFERLPSGVGVSIEESTDVDVKTVNIGLKLTGYADLDSFITLRDLGVLVQKSELSQEQADAMLIDGQIYEKYNGVL